MDAASYAQRDENSILSYVIGNELSCLPLMRKWS